MKMIKLTEEHYILVDDIGKQMHAIPTIEARALLSTKMKYSEEVIRAVFMHGFLLGVDRGEYSKEMEDKSLSTYLQSPTEWEVEFINGNLTLKP